MQIRSLAALLLVAGFGLAGCRTLPPIYNVADTQYGGVPTAAFSLADYQAAIIRGASKRGWVATPIAPGHLKASTVVRGKHTAVVDIFYNTSTFSITYNDSKNLNYDPVERKIHPNYNSWIGYLESDIQQEIQLMRAG